MLRPTAVHVVPAENFHLVLTFDNGEIRIFDVNPYIRGSWYGQLNDPTYFSAVAVNGFSVEWPNGQDLCPDELYYQSIDYNPEPA